MTTMEMRVAGSDTREALATPAVRAANRAAMLGAAPGIAAAFSAHTAWSEYLDIQGTAVWLTPLLLILMGASGLLTWRNRWGDDDDRPGAMFFPLLLGTAAVAVVVAASAEVRFAAVALPIVAIVSGLTVATAAFTATRACVASVRPAAAGMAAAFALGGTFFGIHIMLVGAGSGIARASGWSAAYLLFAAFSLRRAWRNLPADRHRIAVREANRVDPAEVGAHAMVLRDITLRFGPNLVLDGATLLVEPNELIALVGANGAGKSTLLRVAAGFLPIEAGQVLVGNEDVTTLRAEERAAAGLSFVSGARPIFPELTVMQNLRVASYRTHKTPAAFERATEALLDLIPTLARRKDDRAGVLSGGEQRLLAVAQTLYRKPTVLLADELTLGLDVDARLAVMDLLQTLAAEGVGVVAVDHDLPSLLPRSTRAVLLTDGRLESYDDPVDLLTRRSDLLPATFLAGVEG